MVIVGSSEPCDAPTVIQGSNPTLEQLRTLKEGSYKVCITYVGEGLIRKVLELDPIEVDNSSPDVAGALTVSQLASTSAIISWPSASDNLTVAGSLIYSIYISTDRPLPTLNDVDANGNRQPGDIRGGTRAALTLLVEKTIYYAAVVVTDDAGNRAVLGNTSFQTPALDVLPPTVLITSDHDSGPTNQLTITLTVKFSEPVLGFDISDINLIGASKGLLAQLTVDTYSIQITAVGSSVSAVIPAGAVHDASGNESFTSNIWSIAIHGAADLPTAYPRAGVFTSARSIVLTTATPDAKIYYTDDGDVPTRASTLYTGAIHLSSSKTIKAIAVAQTYNDSSAAVFEYTITGKVAAPTFSVGTGSYGPAQSIALTTSTPGATIYYTTDGQLPTKSSSVYSSPFTVAISQTVKAFAVLPDWDDSTVASESYIINGAAATPIIGPSIAGTYNSSQNVSISSATAEATIYYSTDGTAPSRSSFLYSHPITVSTSQSIRAIAIKTGFSDSAEASADYVIDTQAPIVTAGNILTANPSASLTPQVTFNSNEDGVFRLFSDASCSSSQAVSASNSGSSGITTVTTTSLAANTATSIYVKAIDLAGNSSCTLIGIYTQDDTAPLPPVIADASRSFNAAFTASIQQASPPDANFKEFRYTTDGTDPTCTVGSASSTQPTSVSISAASVTLKVVTCDLAGLVSDVSTVVYTYNNLPPTLDSPVKYLNSLGLNWTSVSGASSYNLYWSSSSGVTTSSNLIAGAVPLYVHSSLTGGQIYYYRVAAVMNGVVGALSNEVSSAPYLYPAPTVISISPGSGTITGGTPITITGTGFQAGLNVTIGGNSASGITVSSSTSIRATAPAGTLGAKDIVVTNSDGQYGSVVQGFVYRANVNDSLVVDLDIGNSSSYPGAGTTVYDLSGKNNHGILVNSVTYNSASGGYLQFDQSNEYINVPNSSTINDPLAGDFAYEIVVKLQNTGYLYGKIFAKGAYLSQGFGGITFGTGSASTTLQFGNPAVSILGAPSIVTNTWYHFVYTRANGTFSRYVNGQFVTSVTNSYDFRSTFPLRISSNSQADPDDCHQHVSVFRQYSRGLNSSEVLGNFNAYGYRVGISGATGPVP